jgi:hypothetical protein
MAGNWILIDSLYSKRLEIHYNSWYIRNKENKLIKLELQGKIKCPLLNTHISSLTCSKIMDRPGWPRAIDESVCKRCDCYVSLSINKFKAQKEKTNVTGKSDPEK